MKTYRENFLYYYENYAKNPRGAYLGYGKYATLTETEMIERAYASADTIAKHERVSARKERLSRNR